MKPDGCPHTPAAASMALDPSEEMLRHCAGCEECRETLLVARSLRILAAPGDDEESFPELQGRRIWMLANRNRGSQRRLNFIALAIDQRKRF